MSYNYTSYNNDELLMQQKPTVTAQEIHNFFNYCEISARK